LRDEYRTYKILVGCRESYRNSMFVAHAVVGERGFLQAQATRGISRCEKNASGRLPMPSPRSSSKT
jgi:hypothetical protein